MKRAEKGVDRRAIMAAGVGLAAIGAVPAAAVSSRCGDRPDGWIPSEALIRELPRLMRVAAVPGVAIAVADQGRLAWSRVFGVKNEATREPVTEETLFEAASMSKPVFAYLVMRLVEEGLLDLQRPLALYYRPDYLSDDPRLERIKLVDVLRHSSGLPNWTSAPLATVAEPGSRYTYSGEAMVWLQIVVEHITGMPLEQVAQARLLRPAGMTRSSFAWDEGKSRAVVQGHSGEDPPAPPRQPTGAIGDKLLPVARRWGKPIASWRYEDMVRAMREAMPDRKPTPNDFIINTAGGLLTTAADYVRFMTLMMDGRRRASWEISEAGRQAMLSPHLEVKGRDIARGLGWELEENRDGRLFQHSGSNSGIFKTLGVGDARRGRAIVILTNGANGNLLAQRIVREAAGLELLKSLV